jgi:hypothetical protein
MTNHSKDHHVLAAAARASAKTIVTYNSKDFPRCSLMPYSITAQGPSAFLKDLYVAATTLVAQRPRERIFSFPHQQQSAPVLLPSLLLQSVHSEVDICFICFPRVQMIPSQQSLRTRMPESELLNSLSSGRQGLRLSPGSTLIVLNWRSSILSTSRSNYLSG